MFLDYGIRTKGAGFRMAGGSSLSSRFDSFEVEVKFLTAKNAAQIELPKLARKAQRRPALIEVGDELETQGTPEVSEGHVGANRFQFNRSVEREGSSVGHEAGERVAVKMVAMRGIRRPVRI